MQRSRPGLAWLLPAFALVVGVFGAAAIWLAIWAAVRGWDLRWCMWVAPLLALDIVFMLRLAAAPAGSPRAALATLGTAAAIAVGLWTLVSAEMARVIGISVFESSQRMGPVLAWEMLKLGASGLDIAFLVLALPLAWRLARWETLAGGLSARRRPPSVR